MGVVKCYCNVIVEPQTSHTVNNPGRIFYQCGKCKFWSWAEKLQPTHLGPATAQAPVQPTTPLRPMKRGASEEPSDIPQASPSQKRTRLIEAVLAAEAGHPGDPSILSPKVSNATIGGTPMGSTQLNADHTAFPQTPTKSTQRLATYSPSPSPDPFDFDLGSQQCNASITQDDNKAYPLGSEEVTPELIRNMVNVLGNIPDYICKLDRKRIATEKGLDARNKKIGYLEDEVKRLKDRQKELELIIVGYETKGFYMN